MLLPSTSPTYPSVFTPIKGLRKRLWVEAEIWPIGSDRDLARRQVVHGQRHPVAWPDRAYARRRAGEHEVARAEKVLPRQLIRCPIDPNLSDRRNAATPTGPWPLGGTR